MYSSSHEKKKVPVAIPKEIFSRSTLLVLQGLKSSTMYQILSEIIKKIKSVPTLTALCAYKHTTRLVV